MKKCKAGWGMGIEGGVAILKEVIREGFTEEVDLRRNLKVKRTSHREI